MKHLVYQALLLCTIFDKFSTQKKPKLGFSAKLNQNKFVPRHLLETEREPCTLTCFRGRLHEASCECLCKRNWRGPSCDERICKPWQGSCSTKTQCVNKLKFCDGVPNCSDGSDENTCTCVNKVCHNGGRLDKVTCACICTSDWTGERCKTPSPANCGLRLVDKSRIIGGQSADIEHYPWQVQLRYRSTRTSWYFVCGGTLISPQHVVTAAHCVVDRITNRWRVYLGRRWRQSGGEKVRDVGKVFVHQQYDSIKDSNDIALMELIFPVSFSRRIQPACLPLPDRQRFNSDSACFVSGWGVTEQGGILPYSLQAAQVVLVPNKQCADVFLDLTDSMICAAESLLILGKVDTCQGDSGGPLSCAAINSHGFLRWHLVGITSYGFGCGKRGLPGVYTKVSKFVDWLDERMNSN
ncbi:chymotrypsin-like elastase family member 2A [Patiria miniata]|uniref:Peptidase S1 domain-containing protein n=1 Tax=Patiria miniata TaxID=46514 RepID=A0A914BFI3_PATMI|nr:chymotrypsin-like elastase family member 2A [Patiria miniata]